MTGTAVLLSCSCAADFGTLVVLVLVLVPVVLVPVVRVEFVVRVLQ
ncbi:hypothetical protein [Streptomyces sp. NPDC056491]